MRPRNLMLAASVVTVGMVGFFLLQTTSVSPDGNVRVGTVPVAEAQCTDLDQCLPELSLTTLDGHVLNSETLRGKVVMINFWATWCRPCIHEMPALQAVYDRHRKDGFVVIGLLADSRSNDAKALDFVKKRNVTYPIVRSTDALEGLFDNPRYLPTSFLYDREGFLSARWQKGIPEDELEAEVGGLMTR